MTAHKFSYEVLFIDDGSTDNSWAVIEQLQQESTHVRAIKFRRNYGKSAALNVGFEAGWLRHSIRLEEKTIRPHH